MWMCSQYKRCADCPARSECIGFSYLERDENNFYSARLVEISPEFKDWIDYWSKHLKEDEQYGSD